MIRDARWAMQSFRTSDGLALRYTVDDYTDRWRPAETVVLLHAAMGSSRRLHAWVPHLAREYRVVRMDHRGHGDSDDPGPDQLSFPRLVADVKELLDHLGLDRVHLAGSSAGGIISQGFAIAHPKRLATLGIFASVPGMKNAATDYGAWVARIGAKGVAQFLRETIADRMDPAKVDPGFIDWFIADAARSRVEVLARFVPMLARVDLLEGLPKIDCPTLCVVPGGDPIHPVEEYRVFERLIRGCRFVVYEGMAHNITDAAADRCAQDYLGFLRAHRKA